MLKPALGLVALFVVLQALFLGLLIAAAAIPDGPIVQNLVANVRAGTYGTDAAPDLVGGRGTSFTDCVAVGAGLGGPDVAAWEEAIRAPRLDSCRNGADQIRDLAAGREVAGDQYFRYWAGYTPLTRVVLSFAGMDALRLVTTAAFGLSLVLLVLSLARLTTEAYALCLLGPLLVASNLLTLSSSFTHALSMAVTFLAVTTVAWAVGRGERVVAYATVAGAAVFNFVDLLTTPAVPWSLTVAVAGAVGYRRTGSWRPALRLVALTGVLWPVVFAATWVTRWVLTWPLLGREYVMDNVLSKVDERLSGAGKASETFGAGLSLNLRTWLDTVATAAPTLIVALAVAAGALLVAARRGGRPAVVAAGVLCLPSLVVLGWLLALNNHSQIHDHFVYRTVPTALGIVMAGCVLAASRFTPRGESPRGFARSGSGSGTV